MAFLRERGLPVPQLFRRRGGVLGLRLDNVLIDILHTVDQGLGSNVIGNIVWYFAVIMGVFGAGTYAQKIQACGEDMKLWYKKRKLSSRLQGKLTLERIRTSGSWPKLKAKAAATRHLAHYALDLCVRFGQVNSLDAFTALHDSLAQGVCQHLVEFYVILNEESMFLSRLARERLVTIGNELTAMYSKLARISFDRGLKLWKVTPKMHLFLHLVLEQAWAFGNPRFWWTYGDEDLVGTMIGIADSVHTSTIAISVMSKWLWCVFDELLFDMDSS